MEARAFRHRVIADNIANLETPNFKASEVSFEAELRAAAEQDEMAPPSPVSALDSYHPTVATDRRAQPRSNGNTVDVDQEMVKLAENTQAYEVAAQLLRLRLDELRTAITEGRR